MTIRLKMILVLGAFAGLVLLLSLSQLILTNNLNQQVVRENQLVNMVKGIFELNVVTTDYLLKGEKRAAEQWLTRYFSLGGLLSDDLAETANEEIIYQEIISNYESLGELFRNLVDLREDRFDFSDTFDSKQELESRLLSQLSIKTQTIVSDSFRLTNTAQDRVISSIAISISAVQIFAFSVSVLGIFATFWVYRSITHPLFLLIDAVKKMTSGDLNVKIDKRLLNGKDEYASLAKAFVSMSGELAQLYGSLETMVSKRTKELFDAQKDLKLKLNELERMNSVLIGRELKMVELKKQISKLENEINEAKR